MQELGGFSSTIRTGHNYPWESEWIKIVASASHKGKQG